MKMERVMETSGTTSRTFQMLSRNIQSLLTEMNKTIQFFPDRNGFFRDYGSFIENNLHQYSMGHSNQMEIENGNNPSDTDMIAEQEGHTDNNIFNLNGLFHLKKNEQPNNEYVIYMNINGHDIDLYKLYIEILCRGGYQRVSDSNLWSDVLKALLFNEETQSLFTDETQQENLKNLEQKLKEYYHIYLFPFECDQRNKYDNIES